MFSAKSVKSTAKQLLSGKWGLYITSSIIPLSATVLAYVISCIIGSIFNVFAMTTVYAVLILFFVSPLFYGVIKYFWDTSNGINNGLSSVFYCFESIEVFNRTFYVNGIITVCVCVTQFVSEVPFLVVKLFSDGKIFEVFGTTAPLWTTNLEPVEKIMFPVTIVLTILVLIRIYPFIFIAVTNENLRPFEAFKIALKVSKVTYKTFFKHLFSYIFVIILSVFVLPLIFTFPYLIMCYITHCRYAVALYNKIGGIRQ